MNTKIFVILVFFVCGTFTINAQDATDFYDTGKVRELRLSFKDKNWGDEMDSLRIHGNDMLMGNAKIDGELYKNVGVRYRGSRSFRIGSMRNALHIKLNYINKNQNHQGYETLKLSNALRDPSMVREVLSYEIARKYMPAPKANYTRLFINDKYIGLFVNVQDIDDKFLTDNFGSSDNSFFKCSPDLTVKEKDRKGCKKGIYAALEYEDDASCYLSNYEMKSKDGWDDLIELTDILNNNPKDIEKVLNVDRTLWMLAFNNVLVNLSSYSGQHSQNYYMYRDSKGLFNPIVWDLNLSFGSFKNTGNGSDLKLKELQELDPFLHMDNVAKPLINKLLSEPAYKKIYLAHLRTILYDNFINGAYEKRAKALQSLIYVPHSNDQYKYYNLEEFKSSLSSTIGKRSKIPGIVELMSKRTKFLKKHPDISIFPPEVTEVKVLDRAKFANKNVVNFKIQAKVEKHAKVVKLKYRFQKDQPFMVVRMKDDGKSNDGKANDNIFGASIDPQGDTLEYYIEAENAAALTFYPSNYMFEPNTSNLEALNK